MVTQAANRGARSVEGGGVGWGGGGSIEDQLKSRKSNGATLSTEKKKKATTQTDHSKHGGRLIEAQGWVFSRVSLQDPAAGVGGGGVGGVDKVLE